MSDTSHLEPGRLPRRPLLAGFHPDPSVCRAGDTYYLACSTFEYAPGVPIFSSPDLLDWTLIGHALDRPSQLDLASARPSGGIYAPTLRFHDDRFWMIVRNSTSAP
ncbi:MAG TPA: family 43 glycosylhydrolase, partial [Humibacter sp.]|nr:family 43 glycosylhydrolase [Humibacter sp.]